MIYHSGKLALQCVCRLRKQSLCQPASEYERRIVRKAVVLLSGGIDSTTTLYLAKEDVKKWDRVYPLSVTYGQKHKKELECAGAILSRLNLLGNWAIVSTDLEEIGRSSLFEKSDEEVPTSGVGEGIPSTWVPQRNSILLSLAFSYAEKVDADFIYTGFNIVDYSGYPDCRPEFVRAMEKALNLASKRYIEVGKGFSIITPIITKTKADIITLGTELGVPWNLTWSCYKGEDTPCGVCDSCRIRLKGFSDVGMTDPLKYQ